MSHRRCAPPTCVPAAGAGPPSFSQIAQRCQQGGYDSPDALQADAAAAAQHVLAAVEEQEQQLAREARRRQQQSPGAVADRWGRGQEGGSVFWFGCAHSLALSQLKFWLASSRGTHAVT